MTWKQAFTSSIGRKFVMSFTGIFLILFLVVHLIINACIWANDDGVIFNRAAEWMSHNLAPRVLEVVLFLGFLVHILQSLALTFTNRTKRKIGYAINYGNRGSKWYSRSMGLLGTLILLFLIMHLAHFWIPNRFATTAEAGAKEVNTFYMMQDIFHNPWVVLFYVIGCLALGYHLAHGFQSAFRTLGVHNPKYTKIIVCCGYAFAIVVPLVFAMMPISMYFEWVH